MNAEEEDKNDGQTLTNSGASCYIFDRLVAINGGLKKIKLAENMLHTTGYNTIETEI